MNRPTMPVQTIGDRRLRLDVSRLCLGAMNFGTRTDEETSFAILDRFREAGGTFLDTSNNYNQFIGGGRGGQSEELLGRWLASRDGARDDMVIATKAGGRTTVPDDPSRANYEGLAAPAVRAAAEGSLKRLGVDRLDVYYAHIDDRDVPLDETAGAFAALAAEGKAGVIGASNITTWRLAEARGIAERNAWAPYTVVQQMHTYLWPKPGPAHLHTVTPELTDYAAGRPDLAITCYSPLFAGYYTRRHRPPVTSTDPVETWRKLAVPGTDWDHAASERRLTALDEITADTGATPNQAVLAWMLAEPVPYIPITSASSIAQLDEILGAVDLVLEDGVLERLRSAG